MKIRKVGYYPNPDDQVPESGGIHGCYELLVIQQGHANLEWLGQLYTVEEPAAFLLSPNSPHKLLSSSTSLRYLYVEFEIIDATIFPALPQLLQWNSLQGRMETMQSEVELFRQSMQVLEQLVKQYAHEKSPLLEEALMNDIRKAIVLVRYLLDNANRMEGYIESVQQSQYRTIEAIMRYMESHYREELSLQHLSDLVHLNGSYLIRLFKKLQGKTPFHYLSALRMNAATSYLQNSSLSIQDIAQASGYSSLHYFSQAFKLKNGMSPSEWRDRNNGTG